MSTNDVTVLMTVYAKIAPAHLRAALHSIWDQTIGEVPVVLVIDGPIPDALADVVATEAAAHDSLRVVPLAHNIGSGPASQAGLELVTTQWVARLDSDDIALPERLERQLNVAMLGGVDVVGTALAEFDDAALSAGAAPHEAIIGIRRMPPTHDEIARYARMNSPVNNPSVLLRTAAVRTAGGYRDRPMMEDYDLYARLLATGARFVNMEQPLTLFRGGDAMLRRRSSRGMLTAERRMQATLVDCGVVSRPRALGNLIVRTAYRLLPTQLLRRANRVLFHRR
ncbi:glycosyltransferase [Corynebacterium sp. TAE3-ERU12]|uniref:glycosyltransferase n=1 Tax=Corynebacterium sp. TAE3-ERU12 TaxID=2849491 RepID=UPI001C46BD4D|nr:glycosyltransferase [Corynebacterium sp. TAE3-ERU12]MBV7294504.1 glycosyltransferase [Corynebacterium sp. TAE3-ERU12]